MVIGGQAVLGYCGRIRTTNDSDAVSPDADRGLLIQLLKECGFDVEPATFGLRAVRRSKGASEVIHISLGVIADESRGEGNIVHYPVAESTYAEAPELPLVGLAQDEESQPVMAPLLPLEDLIVTKILPIGRTTDMEDAVQLIETAVGRISPDEVAARIRSSDEVRLAAMQRLEDLAEFVREQQLGTVWLGRAWTPVERDRILRFIRDINSRIQW